jgi:hypothetical protein
MKVRDLIEKLKTFDPETLVVTSGMDQTDYEELRKIELIEIVKNPEGSTSFGDYGDPDSERPEPSIKAVLVDYF